MQRSWRGGVKMVCILSSLEGNFTKKTRYLLLFLGIRTTSLVWHFRLGHPSLEIVNRVVKEQSLPVSIHNFNKTASYPSCQLGKSKRQPFSRFYSCLIATC
jgi:hypothetical protein